MQQMKEEETVEEEKGVSGKGDRGGVGGDEE